VEGRVEGWPDGANESEGLMLGPELGAPLNVGLVLGWPDGTPDIDGWSDASRDGLADTLGNWEGIIVQVGLEE
jgi:hypothetical protein